MADEQPTGDPPEKLSGPVANRLMNLMLLSGQRLADGEMSMGQFWACIGDRENGGDRLRELETERLADRGWGSTQPGGRDTPGFGPSLGLSLGVSLGQESLRATLVDANGSLRHQREADAVHDRFQRFSKRQVLLDIGNLCRAVLTGALDDPDLAQPDKNGRPVLPILGAAAAWPTPIHRVTKLPEGNALSKDEWFETSLEQALASQLRLSVEQSSAMNDANATALGVAFDESRREPRVRGEGQVALALCIGGGIGAGTALIDRYSEIRSSFLGTSLLEGSHGFAGELGHAAVEPRTIAEINKGRRDGLAVLKARLPCSCGQQESIHLETVASASAIVERLQNSHGLDTGLKRGGQRHGPSVMHEKTHQFMTSRIGQQALIDAGRLIGRSLATPILMLNPVVIKLTGSAACEALAKGILEERRNWQSAFSNGPDPDIEWLGDDYNNKYAAARGAALAVTRTELFAHFDRAPFDLKSRPLLLGKADIAGMGKPI